MPHVRLRLLTSLIFVHRTYSHPSIPYDQLRRPLRPYSTMSEPQPMAVVAPSYTSDPITLASHAPQVLSNGAAHADDSSDEEMPLSQQAPKAPNGAPGKRIASSGSSSSEEDRPLVSTASGGRPPLTSPFWSGTR